MTVFLVVNFLCDQVVALLSVATFSICGDSLVGFILLCTFLRL